MARPLRITYPGAFYHITSRGNERKQIFRSLADREKFLFYLESATRRYDAIIHIKAVESAFNQQPALVKNVSLYLCHRHTASSLKQIGRLFNIGESAVSQASRRIDMKIKRDKKLNKKIKRVENKLNLSKV
jgi:hypothetical protein